MARPTKKQFRAEPAEFSRGLTEALRWATTREIWEMQRKAGKVKLPDPDVIAIHEAGHAVMAYVGRATIERVTIEPSKDTAGDALVTEKGCVNLGSLLSAGKVHQLEGPTMDDSITFLMGGPVSEAIFTGRPSWQFASADLAKVVLMVVGEIRRPDTETVKKIAMLWQRTYRCLRRASTWRAVEELAQEVVRRKTISGAKAEKLISQALPDRPIQRRRKLLFGAHAQGDAEHMRQLLRSLSSEIEAGRLPASGSLNMDGRVLSWKSENGQLKSLTVNNSPRDC